MRENRTSGTVWGAPGDRRSYHERHKTMKRKTIRTIFAFTVFLFLFSSEVYAKDRGSLVSISECNDKSSLEFEECIVCVYDNKTLNVKHLNATYNCCFDDITTRIFVENETISIRSYEKNGGQCDCVCEYDVEYEIPDLKPSKYVLEISNSTSSVHDEVKETVLDLTKKQDHKYCIKRHQ
jgi:hypothetical protein